ncbi:MAG: hypothetical protein F6J98_02275 [Moorea sp. SIO4G2]|nr:hypothetical protein [Moorena sp. SIO4G2]
MQELRKKLEQQTEELLKKLNEHPYASEYPTTQQDLEETYSELTTEKELKRQLEHNRKILNGEMDWQVDPEGYKKDLEKMEQEYQWRLYEETIECHRAWG